MIHDHDTIAAPATAPGGALAVIRVSGADAVAVCDRIFRGRSPLAEAQGYTLHYGRIVDGDTTLDDVLVSVFRAPHSYTGEDSVEISCHGSSYIVSETLRLLRAAGARMATPGEFTTRAFLAGKLDLAQAEAVADLIASSSRAAHALASTQMRGGYSAALGALRDRLLHLTSLLELELDFSEEDVEFADRTELRETMERIIEQIDRLRDSFSLGNAIKEGVAVAIVGAPNVGKSTLLNRLVGDDRAMVSDIPGTTRDVIEEAAYIDGIRFRFLDTAGIRATDDRLERMGIERTFASLARARIILCLSDAAQPAGKKSLSDQQTPHRETQPSSGTTSGTDLRSEIKHHSEAEAFPEVTALCKLEPQSDRTVLHVVNKIDCVPDAPRPADAICISAKNGDGMDRLRKALRDAIDTSALYHGDAVVSNNRHAEALTAAREALARALNGLTDGLSADLLSEDIRQALHHLGTITGQITTDEVLHNIFSKFCIGK